MLKKEFIVQAGKQSSDAHRAILEAVLSPEELERVQKEGAKILITALTPWPRPKKPKAEPKISPDLLQELQSLREDAPALESRIAKFSSPELLKIAELLSIPMTKSGKIDTLRARLFGSLRSEIVWRGISGQSPL